MAPRIGITADLFDKDRLTRVSVTRHYVQAVQAAGGLPLILPPVVEHVPAYLELCDGIVLTGGDDPVTEPFGVPTHPRAHRVHSDRQRFETALLTALDATDHPVLGICLGMQMMALHHGGRLHQHLLESHPDSAASHDRAVHRIQRIADDCPALPESGEVFSRHRQAVAHPGTLHVAAVADDELIEAIHAPGPRLYLGVQWHPERTETPALGHALFNTLIQAAE